MERKVDTGESQIVEHDSGKLAAPVQSEPTMMQIIDRAMQSGRTAEELTALFALSERMAAVRAKQAFAHAMAAFKAECPPVERRTENPQFKVTRNGVTEVRKFASLQDIEATVRGPLGNHGLSYRWGNTDVKDNVLSMACIVSHDGGHSESSAVSLPVDSKAGCSEQQKLGIVMTYAQRYSLIQALGLTTCDEDLDGNDTAGEVITENQAANLQAALDSVTMDKTRQGKFRERFGIKSMSELTLTRYGEALAAIERARKGVGN